MDCMMIEEAKCYKNNVIIRAGGIFASGMDNKNLLADEQRMIG